MQTTVAGSLQSGAQVIDKTLEELETFLTRQKEVLQVYPRVVKLNGLIPSGCLFEVSTPVEVFRVEKYGNEKEFTAVILAELKQSDTFFDIGASVGLVAVHAGKKGVSTYAFEPDPQVRERLHINLKLNRLTNVQTVAWAVSDGESEATLYTDGVDGRSPSLREVGQRGETTVATDSIDNAIQRKELPVPDVIKIDIEGAEALALPGMKDTLTSDNSPRVVFIELHPEFLPDFGATSDEVVAIIESYGYTMDEGKQRAEQVHCVFRKTS
jgi:FkbM family methyltransferase